MYKNFWYPIPKLIHSVNAASIPLPCHEMKWTFPLSPMNLESGNWVPMFIIQIISLATETSMWKESNRSLIQVGFRIRQFPTLNWLDKYNLAIAASTSHHKQVVNPGVFPNKIVPYLELIGRIFFSNSGFYEPSQSVSTAIHWRNRGWRCIPSS